MTERRKRPKAPPAAPLDPLLTVADVAAFIKMEPKTVYQYAKAGILRSHRIGGRLRFTREDVLRFVNAHARSWEFGAPRDGGN